MNVFRSTPRFIRSGLFLFLLLALPTLCSAAADTCKNRGDLDERYCDEDRDLVADSPKDPKQWKDPPFLLFTYSPLEDPAVYEKVLEKQGKPVAASKATDSVNDINKRTFYLGLLHMIFMNDKGDDITKPHKIVKL